MAEVLQRLGDVGEYEVEAYLQGLLSLPSLQRDLLALAANELIDELPRLHAPYSKDLTTKPDLPEVREGRTRTNKATRAVNQTRANSCDPLGYSPLWRMRSCRVRP